MNDDPFATLENAARNSEAEERALKAIAEARVRLVLGKDATACFFATLALRLVPEVCWDMPTMATDGKSLRYNPDFVNGMKPEEVRGVVVHEVMHNALAHTARLRGRDPMTWNIACDLAINPIVAEAGYTLPKGGLMPGEGQHKKLVKGQSAEEYYDQLLRDKPPEQDGGGEEPGKEPGKPSPDPGKCGGVEMPGDGSEAACREAQADAEVAVAQAHQTAKMRGKMSAGLERLVQQALNPKVDWKQVLREFVSRHARSDYSWTPPNRRYIHQGIYLPGLRSEELGEVMIAVDTSGSIGDKELAVFGSEIQGILDGYDCTLTILYHDDAICGVQHWRSSDGPLVLEAKGGGGTSHVPVFDWIDKQGDSPACLVCLTDMCSSFPSVGPEYPVLWAAVGAGRATAPFGQLVEVC